MFDARTIRRFTAAAMAAVALVLGACQQNIAGDRLEASQANQASRSEIGTVISYRPVTVQQQNPSYLTGAGALAGGVAGSQLGGGTDENILGAIGGTLAGGLAGYAIEQAIQTQTGVEYTIQMQSGQVITVVQDAANPIPPGSTVLVSFGQRTTVQPYAGPTQIQYPGGSAYPNQYPGSTQYPGQTYPGQTYPTF
ncbi:MAG: glycine zipper 2TM domain-containing protein [Azospirillaceae bacterium]